MTINFQQLIQNNTKQQLTEAKADLERVIADSPANYELHAQLKEYEIAIAWEAPNAHQLEQFKVYDLKSAKRHMKQIKLERNRKRSRKAAAKRKLKMGVKHILFPLMFENKDREFQFALTGCEDLDKSYKTLYGKQCPKTHYTKKGTTVFAEIVEFVNETFRQEYLKKHPRAVTAVGYTGVRAEVQHLVDKYVTETSLIKGFRSHLKPLYRIKESRGAMGNPDSQLPVMYTSMKRNWK